MINSIIRKLKLSSLTSNITFNYKEQQILDYLKKIFIYTEPYIVGDKTYYMDKYFFTWIMDIEQYTDDYKEGNNKYINIIYLNDTKTNRDLYQYFYIINKDNDKDLSNLLLHIIKEYYRLDKSKNYTIRFIHPTVKYDIELSYKQSVLTINKL